MKNKKFVCLECGSHNVEGEIPAMVELKINNLGDVEIISMEWDYNEEGLFCSECGSYEITEIGKRIVC